jgi:hypothetical protein
MDTTSCEWQQKSQLVLPILFTPLGADITATIKPGQPISWYTGLRASGFSLADTVEYSCKVGQIKGPTAKVSVAYGLGLGVTGSTSVSSDGSSRLGVSGAIGVSGLANKDGGIWGFSPLSPGIGWTWRWYELRPGRNFIWACLLGSRDFRSGLLDKIHFVL